jgi:hypothetical protein
VIAGGEARVFTGDGNANASTGGIAFGQDAGDVHLGIPHPSQPGRYAP